MPSIDYRKISATGYQAFMQVHRYIGSCGLEPALVHMVYLRISQINGCAYCVRQQHVFVAALGAAPWRSWSRREAAHRR